MDNAKDGTKRLVIAVDCDDVLVPTTHYFVDAYNKKYGTNVRLDEKERNMQGDYAGWGIDHDELLVRLAELQDTDAYRSLGPTEQEILALQQLATKHELRLVTARMPHELETTQDMLERDLPGVFTSLEFVGHKGSKGEVCRKLHADVLIDDNVRHLEDAIKLGLPQDGAILFGNYAWNEQATHSTEVFRCADWSDVIERINYLSEVHSNG